MNVELNAGRSRRVRNVVVAMTFMVVGSTSALGGTYENTAPSPSSSWKVGASPG